MKPIQGEDELECKTQRRTRAFALCSAFFWGCHSSRRRLTISSYDNGEDPFAELGAVLRNAFIYAAGAGLKGIKNKQWIKTLALGLAGAIEPVGSDAVH